MAITIADTFTDTDGTLLANHDPDTGDANSWQAMDFAAGGASPANTLEINSNRLQPPNVASQTPIHRNNTDPGADDYDIVCVMAFAAAAQASRFHSVTGRMSTTGTANGDVDRYLVFADGSATQEWQLYKIVAGTLTLLDSQAATLAGNTFDVRIEFRSTSTTVSVFADDGTGEVQVLSTIDTDVTQRGRVGVGEARGDNDHWIDTFSVDSVGAADVTGSGEIAPEAVTMSGSGDVVVTGTGAMAVDAAFLDGTGTVGSALITGSGEMTAPSPALDGTGIVAIAGDGALLAPAALLDGAAAVAITGSGEMTAPPAFLSGSDAPLVIGRPLQPLTTPRPIQVDATIRANQSSAASRPIQPTA